uniref:C2H2-type domain-containing protein n=1 Tax=Neogobius melanostomus TaxID=47308 RepID=A0A8C6WV51_9GOBI
VSACIMSCPLYGCKRAYPDANALQSHIKDHELPAQSLPGKTMMCSMVGCGGTFPNMQKLMEHLRHHHKPNIYFLCESCHAKLRSYRGLLIHLRTCSKAARPKQNPVPSPSTSAPPVPMDVDQVNTTAPPQDTLSSPPPAQLNPDPPQLNPIPPQRNPILPLSDQPPLLSPKVQPGPSTNEGQVQQQRPKTPELSGAPKICHKHSLQMHGGLAKVVGPIPEKRIQWQHTRGRYTCGQCRHTVTNRREMTEHSTVHSDSISTKEEPHNPASTSA